MFEICLKKTLKYEGVYSNHPLDRGGETYRGIARNFHPKWRGWKIVDRLKKQGGINALHERNTELNSFVADFYKKKFWNKVRGDDLEKIDKKLACNVFDFAVNAGVKRSIKRLQKALNRVFRAKGLRTRVVEDGVIGPITLGYVETNAGDFLLNSFKVERAKYYIKLVKKNNDYLVFLDGWVSRTISA